MALIGVEPDAVQLANAYREAERRIVERIAAELSQGLEAPQWEIAALQRAQTLRIYATQTLQAAGSAYAAASDARVAAMYESGAAALVKDVGGVLPLHEATALTKRAAVKRVTGELSGLVNAASGQVLRRVDDVYRSVIGEVVQAAAARGISRTDAAIEAMSTFAEKGIGSFADAGGRNWTLGNYVDMATRTGLAKAQNLGHADAMRANGLDLVIVQPGPRACETCDEWARMILSLDGPTGEISTTDVVTGETIAVMVDGTVADAELAGFDHPNCRCSLSAYIPGATDKSAIERPPWDQEAYQAQQQQRAIENAIRADKLTAAAAIDPSTKAAAEASVRDSQQRMRDHLAANPDLKRQSGRESITGRFSA